MIKEGRLLSNLAKKFRNPDGRMNWRVVASATYASAVWSIMGVGALAYKTGSLKLNTQKGDAVPVPSVTVDWKERARVVAEDVAENIYTSENFMG